MVQFGSVGGWLFSVWQPDVVSDTLTGRTMPFPDAPNALLVNTPDAWVLRPGDTWHGFADLEDGYCKLDPINVSIVTPGISRDGRLEKTDSPPPSSRPT